jgi:hypothetical protein
LTVYQVIEIIKVIPEAVKYQYTPHNNNLLVYLSYNFRWTRRNLITLQKIALLLSIKVIHTTKFSMTHSNDLKVLF